MVCFWSALDNVTAIRQIYSGRRYVTSSLGEMLADKIETDTEFPLHELLSDREYQVFRQLGSGHSAVDIASQLSLSPKTISTYRTRILEKMRLSSTAELIRYAVEHQLVD